MHNVEIFGLSLGGYFLVAVIWIVVWFVILRLDDDLWFIPLAGSLLTAWVFGTVIPSMWAGFVAGVSGMVGTISFGSLGSIVQGLGYLVLGLLGLGVIGVLGYLAVVGTIEYFRRQRPAPQPTATSQARPVPNQAQPSRYFASHEFMQPYQLGTDEFFHGTSLDAAVRIFSTRLWKVGTSHPPGIYMSPDFDVARYYAEQGAQGAIIVIKAHPSAQLVDRGGKIILYPIDDAVPDEEFYRIQALTPDRVLDVEGRHIM